jgi:hypothetical protein
MNPVITTPRARAVGGGGQSSLELALVLPFVCALAMLVLQGALVARDHVLVVHAARAAAREASVGADDARVRAAATNVLPGADVRIRHADGVGEPVGVRVRYLSRTEVPLVGGLLPDATIEREVVMRAER